MRITSGTPCCFSPGVARLISPHEAFVTSRHGLYQEVIPEPLLAVFMKCTTPRTLRAHAHDIWSQLPLREKCGMMKAITRYHARLFGDLVLGPGSFQNMLEHIFDRAAEKGLFEAILMPPVQGHRAPSISAIGIMTRDRLLSATACLESYIAHCTQWGRTVRFLVFDDSPEPETRNRYRQLLGQLKKRHQVLVCYAGLEEKAAFARQVIERGIPPEVVQFAISDPLHLGSTYGANRNCFLLDTVGGLAFSTDDDTLCTLRRSPDYRAGVRLGPISQAIRVEAFPDHHSASSSVSIDARDVLALHETVLGKHVRECVPNRLEHLSMDGSDSHFLRAVTTDHGRIVVSVTGLIGDSGSNVTVEHLGVSGELRTRLLRSRQHYQLFASSRIGIKSVEQLTIDRADTFMTTFFGVDHRALLPPFFPVFRMEDALFGQMLRTCDPEAYMGFLPWLLEHAPQDMRVSQVGNVAMGSQWWPGQLIHLATQQLQFPPKAFGPEESYALLSGHLKAIGRMPFGDFRECYVEQRCLLLGAEMERLSRLLERYPHSPSYWVSDVKTALAFRKSLLGRPVCLAPDAMVSRFGPAEAERRCQQLVLRYGELLSWWPEIRRIMRDAQIRIAQPLAS